MITEAELRKKMTSSPSLVFDAGVWAHLARAEVLAKLLSPEQKVCMKRLAQRLKRS